MKKLNHNELPSLPTLDEISASTPELTTRQRLSLLLGGTAIVAATVGGITMIESSRNTQAPPTFRLESPLRDVADAALASGPDSPDDVIAIYRSSGTSGYSAVMSAIKDAAKRNLISSTSLDATDSADYASITASSIAMNEQDAAQTDESNIILFYKDIDGDGKKEIFATRSEMSRDMTSKVSNVIYNY